MSVRPGDRVIGKYLVERVLGEGGMGVVVSAHHETLNQRVAIKFLLPAALGDQSATERFVREARAAAQIQSEHVARVTDVGQLDSGAPYMVMEYLEGQDLSDELKSRGALPPSEAADYMLQALEALAEAHAVEIIHRDLKPANIFLAERKDGSRLVKVLDFGISKTLSAGDVSLTATSALMGSPLYMAPEQIRDAKSVDCRADIWSLGVILYECLSGDVPFGGDTLSGLLAQIVADPPPPLRTVRPDLPESITSIVDRCLEKNRERRVQNVAELARLLAPLAPEGAMRSVERIHSTLGIAWDPAVTNTHQNGTPPDAMDRTQMAPPGKSTLPSGSGEMTERPWTQTQDAALVVPKSSSRLPIALGSVAVVLLGLAGSFLWNSGGAPTEASQAVEETEDAPAVESTATKSDPPAEMSVKKPDPTPPPDQQTPEETPQPEKATPAKAPARTPQPTIAAVPRPRVAPAPRPAPQTRPKSAPAPQTQAAPAPRPKPAPSPAVGDPLLGRH